MANDLKWPIRVQVTQEDIDQGEADNCFDCPVALALKRVTGAVIEVNNSFAIVDGVAIRLPPTVEIWIANFDYNGPDAVKPFSFSLELPA